MSENVKIVINEYDLTKPITEYTSSDIVFMPGFSSLPTNNSLPKLCTTWKEFTQAFGDTPYYLTSSDISALETIYLKGIEGTDKSFYYAKTLLQQNIPVVYMPLNELSPSLAIDTINDLDTSTGGITISTSADDKFPATVTYEGADKFSSDINCSLVMEHTLFSNSNTTEFITFMNNSAATVDITFVQMNEESSPSTNQYVVSKYMSTNSTVFKFEKLPNSTLSTFTPEFSFTISNVVLTSTNNTVSLDLDVNVCTSSANIALTDFEILKDRNEYNVKYLTSGGYASTYIDSSSTSCVHAFADMLSNIAGTRGDCVALVDYEYTTTKDIFNSPESSSIYKDVSASFKDNNNASYAAAFQPWAKYDLDSDVADGVLMPPSFGYLSAMAKSTRTNPNWLAVAGVSRGIVPKIKSLACKNNMLNNMLAEEMQPKFGDTNHQISINCITDIKPYGLTIWGNRTLRPLEIGKSTTATNFLNTRNMISDIKKVLYSSAKSLMFEQNSDDLWLRFKALVTPLLNQLKSGSAISDFKIIKLNTKYDGQPLVKGEIAATIRVYPMYAVEYFELNVELSDQDVTVNG